MTHPQIPPGWRLLHYHEIVQEGDDLADEHADHWSHAHDSVGGIVGELIHHGYEGYSWITRDTGPASAWRQMGPDEVIKEGDAWLQDWSDKHYKIVEAADIGKPVKWYSSLLMFTPVATSPAPERDWLNPWD